MTPVPAIEFVSIGAGAVAVMHRPKVKLLPKMRSAGTTHLVTLLSKREGALAMGSAAKAAGLEWIWVELANGQQPPPARRHEIVESLTTLTELIRDGAKVVVHCSAGIHRTGMFTYALLRACDLGADEAISALTQMRVATAEGVGQQRLDWAEVLSQAVHHRLEARPPLRSEG